MTAPAVPTTTEPTNTRELPHSGRVAVIAVALAMLVAVLLGAFALPARAATANGNVGNSAVGSGVGGNGVGGAVDARPAVSGPTDSTGALVFGGFCLALIVATAGGVLWYTVRTRRSL
jgi:hypothetical protein